MAYAANLRMYLTSARSFSGEVFQQICYSFLQDGVSASNPDCSGAVDIPGPPEANSCPHRYTYHPLGTSLSKIERRARISQSGFAR